MPLSFSKDDVLDSTLKKTALITMCKSLSKCSGNISMLSTTFPLPGWTEDEIFSHFTGSCDYTPAQWEHVSLVWVAVTLPCSFSYFVNILVAFCRLPAKDHHIPSPGTDLMDHSVAWGNPLLELHFQSSLQSGMAVKKQTEQLWGSLETCLCLVVADTADQVSFQTPTALE